MIMDILQGEDGSWFSFTDLASEVRKHEFYHIHLAQVSLICLG